jgi:phosphatidate cytidylyltransferase
MDNFKQRVFTSIGLIITVLVLINLGSFGLLLLVVAINLGAQLEFYRLVAVPRLSAWLGMALGLLLIVGLALVMNGLVSWLVFFFSMPIIAAIYIFQLYAANIRPFEQLAYTFFGIVYITLPLCFFTALAFVPLGGGYNPELITGCFILLWASDTGAYLLGKRLGAHFLFKRISPHKTWEGYIGGLISAVVIALVISRYVLIMSAVTWVILAIIISIAGVYGDLLKSMLKRSLGVKDTGNVLPGHGGMLDRFDSLLGAAPFLFTYFIVYEYFKV